MHDNISSLSKLFLFSLLCYLISLLPPILYEEYFLSDETRMEIGSKYLIEHSDNEELVKLLKEEPFIDNGSIWLKEDGSNSDDTLIRNKVFFKYAKNHTELITWVPWLIFAIALDISSIIRLLVFSSFIFVGFFVDYLTITELILSVAALLAGRVIRLKSNSSYRGM